MSLEKEQVDQGLYLRRRWESGCSIVSVWCAEESWTWLRMSINCE